MFVLDPQIHVTVHFPAKDTYKVNYWGFFTLSACQINTLFGFYAIAIVMESRNL